jgi:hypothetical protein
MRLSKAGAARLYDLARDVERFSLRSQFIIARWMARDSTAAREHYDRWFARALRSASDPDQTAALAKQAQQLREGQSRLAEHICFAVRKLDRQLTAAASFDAICDLLGVNPVHRAAACQEFTVRRGAITTIAFIAGLEDSACSHSGRKVDEFKRGPLFAVFWAGFRRELKENPGLMDGLPVAPQSAHEPAFYTRLADGTIAGGALPEPASLGLHEAMFSDDATQPPTGRQITKH